MSDSFSVLQEIRKKFKKAKKNSVTAEQLNNERENIEQHFY